VQDTAWRGGTGASCRANRAQTKATPFDMDGNRGGGCLHFLSFLPSQWQYMATGTFKLWLQRQAIRVTVSGPRTPRKISNATPSDGRCAIAVVAKLINSG
jgi:hypothetical protein